MGAGYWRRISRVSSTPSTTPGFARCFASGYAPGVLVRLIGKWLKAGVLEAGSVYHPETGTPQGGVISPLLANIYLHEVLDVWFEQQVRPRLRGRARQVRYADDLVMVFETKVDARRVLSRAAEAIWQVRPAPPP
jgi:hypothetical protein